MAKAQHRDPLAALAESVDHATTFLPWDTDREGFASAVEDVLPRAGNAYRTLGELTVLIDSWEPGEFDDGERLLLDHITEVMEGWR